MSSISQVPFPPLVRLTRAGASLGSARGSGRLAKPVPTASGLRKEYPRSYLSKMRCRMRRQVVAMYNEGPEPGGPPLP